MRPFLSAALIISLAWPCAGQEVTPGETVPPGTELEIELLENISSETLHAGQSISFKLVRALKANGVTLLPAGKTFTGTVRTVNAAGHWGKAGAFNLTLEPLRLPNGDLLRMDFHRPTKVNARGEKMGEEIGTTITMLYYFPLIPAALIASSRKGKPFKIRTGERYLVYVTGTEAAATEPPNP